MCYDAVDKLLTEAETKLRKLIFNDIWNRYNLGNQSDNAVEAATEISHMAVSAIAAGSGAGCCADSLVRLQDATDRMEDGGDPWLRPG
mgnify:CR=1 FL=1